MIVISLADHYGIDPYKFDATGALDPILGFDTRLFIDPSLLSHATTPELSESYSRIGEHFSQALKVIKNIQKPSDAFWRAADRMLTFPEVRGLCIGYSSGSTGGRGTGAKKRARILETAASLIKAGIDDEALFELVGTFEEGIGPDLISDMVAKIIIADLVAYTQRICSDLGIPLQAQYYIRGQPADDLPFNPFDGSPIILFPKEILRDLPVAEDYSDISWVANYNQNVRDQLNNMLVGAYHSANMGRKDQLKYLFQQDPALLRLVIEAYRKADAEIYDFGEDPAGETIWYRVSREIPKSSELVLKLSKQPTREEVFAVVEKICRHFQMLVEDNQLCKLLYDKGGARKHESAAQLLFFGIAESYCRANNLDLSPEGDSGRGPVDFKVSSGFEGRVLVEIKLTSNKQLLHGFEAQLPIYQRAEADALGIYLVIDNGGATRRRMMQFSDAVKAAGDKAPCVIMVDGIVRESASKADE